MEHGPAAIRQRIMGDIFNFLVEAVVKTPIKVVGDVGNNIGRAVGEVGDNIGKAVDETGKNIGKSFEETNKAVESVVQVAARRPQLQPQA